MNTELGRFKKDVEKVKKYMDELKLDNEGSLNDPNKSEPENDTVSDHSAQKEEEEKDES